jgi:exopolysaccharide production protein ExoQ
MIWWTMIESASSTAFMSLIVAMAVMVILGRAFVVKRFVGVYVVLAVAAIFAADAVFGMFDAVIGALGEDTTLTGRTELWDQLFAMRINPVIGVGFESFWMGERLEALERALRWTPNEAHNGYLETYLNLGILGLAILLCLMIATYRKGRRALLEVFESGRMRLSFLAAVVVYNWTEASFRTLHIVSFGFYLIALDYSGRRAAESSTVAAAGPRENRRTSSAKIVADASRIRSRRQHLDPDESGGRQKQGTSVGIRRGTVRRHS